MKVIGFDIETTGLNPHAGHRIIQAAVAIEEMPSGTVRSYSTDVCPHGWMVCDPDAMRVNRFDEARIRRGTPQQQADRWLCTVVRTLQQTDAFVVGWNVGGFDIAFARKELPEFFSALNGRCVDLTGLAVLEAYRRWGPTEQGGYRAIKHEWHDAAEKRIGEAAQWHDAGWDARAALTVWKMLKEGAI